VKSLLPILLVLACLPCLVKGQVRIGLLGGYQTSTFPKNPQVFWDQNKYQFSNRYSLLSGIQVEVPFKRTSFSLLSGFDYAPKGRNLFLADPSGTSGNVTEIRGKQYVDYVELPLQLQYDLSRSKKYKIELAAGGYISFLYKLIENRTYRYNNGQQVSLTNTDLRLPNDKIPYQDKDLGMSASLSISVGKIKATAFYSASLTDLYKNNLNTIQPRNRTIGATLTLFFKNFKKNSRKKRSVDSDKDGIPDLQDACPNLPGSIALNGCPDSDGDSIPDLQDQCPLIRGLVKYNGCPIPDTDGDGVNDEKDQCPLSMGPEINAGCPVLDADRDGVLDTEDRCPDIPGLKQYEGCPMPDRDRDGVDDDYDRCPSIPGDSLNFGCPAIRKEIKTQAQAVSKRIQFNYKSTQLTIEAKRGLDIMVRLLKSNSDLKVYIEGHSSIDGNPKNHQPMSEARALAVRNYLLSRGIASKRLKAIGFGSNWPLMKGNSAVALSLNRRVELRLSNYELGF
jgi:outer membrane protein OmpA-like peptidoglycan-associated protein